MRMVENPSILSTTPLTPVPNFKFTDHTDGILEELRELSDSLSSIREDVDDHRHKIAKLESWCFMLVELLAKKGVLNTEGSSELLSHLDENEDIQQTEKDEGQDVEPPDSV